MRHGRRVEWRKRSRRGLARMTGGTASADDIPALLAEVEAGFAGPSSLLFLPYLAGERTPHTIPMREA